MRALNHLKLPAALTGWLHERLEWAMYSMLYANDAVLVIEIDLAGEVKLSLDEVRPTPALSLANLCVTNNVDKTESSLYVTGVQVDGQPLAGDVWIEAAAVIKMGTEEPGADQSFASPEIYTATATLCSDLAQTLGYAVKACPLLLDEVTVAAEQGRAFFISDEFGFIPIGVVTDEETSATARLAGAFAKLW